jgi:uncharacterized OB-fold protein
MTAEAMSAAPAPMPVNRDNHFWVDGVADGKLLIQRCTDCGHLRHPPGPMCPDCRSVAWDTVEASGRGTVYSYTIHHKPPIPGFTTPFAILLVELPEGIRIIGNLVEAPAEAAAIDMAVELVFPAEGQPGHGLPQWRPAADSAA